MTDVLDIFAELKRSQHLMTKQQYATIKGQIKAGDLEAAARGIKTIRIRSVRKKPPAEKG